MLYSLHCCYQHFYTHPTRWTVTMSKRQLPLSSFFRSPSADETDRTAEMTDDDTTHDATDDIENLPTDHTARTTTPSRRSKRQRYTATATDDTTTKADIKAHAEYCMKYHTKQASKQQHPLSFASMKPPPRNATQQSIYVQFLRVCMALVNSSSCTTVCSSLDLFCKVIQHTS